MLTDRRYVLLPPAAGWRGFWRSGKNDNFLIKRAILSKAKNMTPPGRAGLGRRQ